MATGGTYGTNSTYGVPLAPSNSPPPGPLWYTHNVLFGALSGVSGDPPFALFTCIWTIWSVGWNSLMAAHAVPRIVRILKGGRHCKDLANALATCLLPHVVVGIIMPLVMSAGLLGCAIGIVIPYGFAFRRAWREEIGSSDAPHDSRRSAAATLQTTAADAQDDPRHPSPTCVVCLWCSRTCWRAWSGGRRGGRCGGWDKGVASSPHEPQP